MKRQMHSAASWLETQRPSPWLYGNRMTRADVTAAISFTYLREKAIDIAPAGTYPALESHSVRCEALEAFRAAAYSAEEAVSSGWSPAH
ncbi:MAG: hypothetical protein IIC08_06540 [Proteobacteria bacterium]|nr:hypothetical protein [Pseudomonadota bacterium]